MTDKEKFDNALRMKAIVDTAIDGIVTIDARGNVESMNRAAANIFGYNPEEVVGNNISMLMPEPYKGNHDNYIRNYQKSKSAKIIGIGREVVGKKKDGSIFPFRLAVSEVELNDGVIYTGIIHDLSEMKKAEEDIRKLNADLEKKVTKRTYELEKIVNQLLNTNKVLDAEILERKSAEAELLESKKELKLALSKEKELNELKTRFVSMASHEFRTPLTSILSSAALIGKYTTEEQQPKREKHISRIKSSVSNLTGILNDFLSLSRLEEGEERLNITRVAIKEFCDELVVEMESLFDKGQKVHHTIQGEIDHFLVDQRILKNILFNLLSNALKYSDKDIYCMFKVVGDKIEIIIKDEGMGIPEEDQKYLFTRFFRAGNVTNIQGTGLGLVIVKRYVDILKGSIRYESKLEKGTTFYVSLPLLNEN